MIYGFDNSYFKWFKRDSKTDMCSNELYVACTRSLDRLILFHSYTENYLPFLNKALNENTEYIEKKKLRIKKMKYIAYIFSI